MNLKGIWFTLILALAPFITFAETADRQVNLYFIAFEDIYDPALAKDAIIRNEIGFEQDFLVLHCLIKKYHPFNLFEIGTCEGKGTMIIKNAMGSNVVYSLDLAPEAQNDYHLSSGQIGAQCTLPYIQLFGDSMAYDYTQHFPIDSWFIDGCHDYMHVYHETSRALHSNPSLIVWHDTDVNEVFEAILDSLEGQISYDIYRVYDTRMSFAIKR